MRVLGFSDPLVPLVLSGRKTVTRRGLTALRRYAPGQVVAVGEAIVPGDLGATVRYRSDQALVRDWRPVAIGNPPAAWTWRTRVLAGTYLPAWAARGFLVITDVREDDASRLADADAILEGAVPLDGGRWSLAPHLPHLAAASPREAFCAYWTHLHGAPPVPGVLGTRIAFRLIDVAEGRRALFAQGVP